jgi:hypothetical protein
MKRELACLTGTLWRRHIFVDIFRRSVTTSVSLATNATYDLVFLHLPMPHKPGIYLPDKDQYTIWGMPKLAGYFNNLVLTDRTLGKLRHAMETSGQWGRTWLIISSDHSWRESVLYDGQRDLRVPFIIKAPGPGKPVTYSPQLNTVLTRDLVLAILRGEVRDEDGAVDWLNAHRSAEPPILGGRQSE